MNFTAYSTPYRRTGFFSKIVLDYIESATGIQPFFEHQVTEQGLHAAINERKKFNTDRSLLRNLMKKQYENVVTTPLIQQNIESLKNENTFTICTAHQPNIFTGHLYFIYKILHTIKVAEKLKTNYPDYNFVPVYFMGSEDADLEELGHVFINGEKYQWNTGQTGAVGRMKVDGKLFELLETISGQLTVHPFGEEIVNLMRSSYKLDQTIEQSTFLLINELFKQFGLLILLPDNAEVKRSFLPIIRKELFEAFSHESVNQTVSSFPADYKVQASGRALNMFYLSDGKRERIEYANGTWTVVNTDLHFTAESLSNELEKHPERFSPNVILRPVLQEWILPNIAFIGGGGEIAYWLQLKAVFEATGTPYPVLILRNSFLLIDRFSKEIAGKLRFVYTDLFKPKTQLLNDLVKRKSSLQLNLEKEIEALNSFYQELATIAGAIDITLKAHTEALQKQALKKIITLEKKMLRSEKNKYEAEKRQVDKLKDKLFPTNNLQERVDNLMPYYAKFGKEFIHIIYENTPSLEQQFTILSEV